MTDTELMLKVTSKAIAPITGNEDAADRLHKAGLIVKEARRIEAMMKELVMDWIDEHGQFEIGAARYYNATSKSTKVKDHGDVLVALLEAHDGKVAKLVNYLASAAWKSGAVKELLGEEQFAELFAVKETRDLKTGKPKRGPKAVSKRFLPAHSEDDRPPIDSEDK